jgi:hypothetical protein
MILFSNIIWRLISGKSSFPEFPVLMYASDVYCGRLDAPIVEKE